MATQRIRPYRRGDAPVNLTGEDGLAGQNMDSDYSGRPLPELTEAEVRRAAATWGEAPAGDVIVLDGGLRVAFGRNAWYEVSPNSARIDFDRPVDASRVPAQVPGPSTLRAARNPARAVARPHRLIPEYPASLSRC